jgi:Tol biopolymer transport system component
MNADGSDPHQLGQGLWTAIEGRPAWSPDGSRIAVNTYLRHNGNAIDILDADSGAVQLQFAYSMFADNVDWSPDGQFVVFDRIFQSPSTPCKRIFIASLKTGLTHQLIPEVGSRCWPISKIISLRGGGFPH